MGNSEVPRAHGITTNQKAAFTRLELLAVLVALTVLAALALPVFAATTANSQIAQCLNNLRQMGRATQMWGSEHRSDPPWYTYVFDGGTRPDPGTQGKSGNTWVEFSYMSNELATPRILACPADDQARVARNFIEYAASATFRAWATSYFINLHSQSSVPSSILFGDYNVQFSPGAGCELGVNNCVTLNPSGGSTVGWTNAVHGPQGQIVRIDGSAFVTSTEELRADLRRSELDNGRSGSFMHVLRGKP